MSDAIVTDRRVQIIDAAARLVAVRGFAATSVDDVIREAQLAGKSHFYHYFRSKEALGFAVLDRQFERFAERGLAVLREPMLDPLVRLGVFIDAVAGVQIAPGSREGSPFGVLAAELADAHEGFRARLAGAFERWAAQLEALFLELDGRLVSGADPARLAQFVIATLEGATLMARVARDPVALQGIAHELKRFVATQVRPAAKSASRRARPSTPALGQGP